MKSYIIIFIALFSCSAVIAQNTFRAIVRDAETKEPLSGASALIKGISTGAVSDAEGLLVIDAVPDGRHTVVFSYLGYEKLERAFVFPPENDVPAEIWLESDESELEEIVISSTRGTRTIEHIPTRIEFIAGEELDEKSNMKPGDIRMLLNESTGIQTQQTSPISANASIRIQGLDGRYTQILKDGFPIYSGAASGLGLLQIPPLDLRQVEIIKGSTSTLYGGGAIAGMVNLISKTPSDERELSFHLNGTSAMGLDVNGFYSQRFEKTGLTLFASRNSNAARDPAGIGFSAIPKFERYTVNPHLFVYFSDKTTADFAVNTSFENRLGGDMLYIRGKGDSEHVYFEDNQTQRVSTQFSVAHRFSPNSRLTFRNSYNYFNRTVSIPGYTFDGRQNGTFSELNYLHTGDKTEWVGGANLWTDHFAEKRLTDFTLRDYTRNTFGFFVQNTTKANGWLSIESGLRGDCVVDYGFALLPRLSALFRISDKWSSRIGGGLGYKTPNIFTEESERIHYRNVLPVNPDINRIEHSYGANADINYGTPVGDHVFLSLNQLFFYTVLDRPIMLSPLQDNTYRFLNIDGQMATKGAETNLKIRYDDFALYVGYTLTDAEVKNSGTRYRNPLTSTHRLNNVLMYEVEEQWKIGLEAYYYSPQRLHDGTSGRSYWICGAMVEKIWEHFSLYANFENFTDTRQTRFESIYTGTFANPVF
ncbi:MAG: TonB-dependent receptor, partial [Tannerella sp.]|nr:TonB-dependent receptor [Tannerella sp.]